VRNDKPALWYLSLIYCDTQRVLVVGSFASGSDVSRELASVSLPADSLPESMQLARERNHQDHPDVLSEGSIKVFQSSSLLPNDMSSFGKEATDKTPWIKLIEHKPLIERIENDAIHFNDGSTLKDIDVIIFATGYYYQFPFFKTTDYPWTQEDDRVCDETIGDVDVIDQINRWEKDGLQGLAIKGLDELKLFLKNDRTCAFIALRESWRNSNVPLATARADDVIWTQRTLLFPFRWPRYNLTSRLCIGRADCRTCLPCSRLLQGKKPRNPIVAVNRIIKRNKAGTIRLMTTGMTILKTTQRHLQLKRRTSGIPKKSEVTWCSDSRMNIATRITCLV
jgi:hypothetical protein